eukprot:536079-Rhodomonas_salina.1
MSGSALSLMAANADTYGVRTDIQGSNAAVYGVSTSIYGPTLTLTGKQPPNLELGPAVQHFQAKVHANLILLKNSQIPRGTLARAYLARYPQEMDRTGTI